MIKKFILWLKGWHKANPTMLTDVIERAGLHGAQIYTKGFVFKIIYKNKETIFPMNEVNDWGELLPMTDAELFDYYKRHISKLKEKVI